MPKPHKPVARCFRVLLFLSLILCVSGWCIRANAQQPATDVAVDRDRGIQLYKQGNVKTAVQALNAAVKKNKEEGEAWYYLGLARLHSNDQKNARKAFGMAVKLRPNFAPAHTALSNSLLFTNRVRDAENGAQRALSLEPQNSEACI